MESYDIRPMRPEDVRPVVSVHLESFDGFFLSYLGPAFLRELYAGILLDPSGVAYVCTNGSRILGFVAGASRPSRFYRRLLRRRWWRFTLASVIPIVKSPKILPRFLLALNSPYQFQASEDAAILMTIAVSPETQGRGVGQQLVRAFLGEARRRKLRWVHLSTDAANNERVNLFYQQLGFELQHSFVAVQDRRMNEYVIALE